MARKRNPQLAQHVGARARSLRVARGLTQEMLAENLGIQPAAVSRFENGVIGLSLTTLVELATALDVPVGRLFNEPDETAPSDEELLLLLGWRALDPAHKVHVRAIVDWAVADQNRTRPETTSQLDLPPMGRDR
jgi:transcriptional regulator with XRE-family HTH domain